MPPSLFLFDPIDGVGQFFTEGARPQRLEEVGARQFPFRKSGQPSGRNRHGGGATNPDCLRAVQARAAKQLVELCFGFPKWPDVAGIARVNLQF